MLSPDVEPPPTESLKRRSKSVIVNNSIDDPSERLFQD